jgi:hypothetical protein
MTTFNVIYGFTFASSRYHSTYPISSNVWQDEDYRNYDILNGTYDKYWGCFSLTESPEPRLECILPNSSTVTVKGDMKMFPYTVNYGTRTVGSVNYQHPLVNSNLDKVTIDFNSWIYTQLNPGWTNIQTLNNSSSGYIARVLGSSETASFLYSVDLPDTNSITVIEFPRAIIVAYKEKYYKALNATSTYPAADNEDWQLLEGQENVFIADVFGLNNGTVKYVSTETDPDRTFKVKDEVEKENSNLISWNLSYFTG